MTDMLTAEQLVEDTSIANRAMKAMLHMGGGAGKRNRDRDAEKLVKDQFGDQGQVVTRRLFTNKAGLVYRRNMLANDMYMYHLRATLPHGDDGSRLLPNPMYFDYLTKMQDFDGELARLGAEIVLNYDQLVQTDIAERNAALMSQGKPQSAVLADYPSAEDVRDRMYVTWILEPISTSSDFRYNVDQHVRERLAARLQEMADAAKGELFARMTVPMTRFIEKLAVPIGETGAVFRDSLVENLNELFDTLPKLNFDNDPAVTSALAELKKLITPYALNPAPLREQPEVRSEARRQMEELKKRLDGYSFGGL